MKKIFSFLIVALLFSCSSKVSNYNIVWDSPSSDVSGSMPIGNGEVGSNVWVEQNGDLLFYIARTDSWSETGELYKLGRIRVSLTPSLTSAGNFRQTLDLENGKISIEGAGTSLDFFIDSDSDVIYVSGKSKNKVDVKITSEIWRDSEVLITPQIAGSVCRSVAGFSEEELKRLFNYTGQDQKSEGGIKSFEIKQYPDQVVTGGNEITVFHNNCYSSYETTLLLESVEPENRAQHDPFLNRTFGYRIEAPGMEKTSDLEIQGKDMSDIDIRIATSSGIFNSHDEWEKSVPKTISPKTAMRRTSDFWMKFWDRSYIYVTTPDTETGEKINSAYILQRWIQACAGRGHFPIKFNGTLFIVEPKYANPEFAQNVTGFNADYRPWGGDYWWQNTRLPYHPMLKSGDFDMMKPLFEHYFANLDVMKANAKALCGVEGALSPETQTVFGTYSCYDFGWDRTQCTDNLPVNKYVRRHWDSSVEMISLMLDYWDYTADREFVKTRIVPYAKEFLLFYENYFKKNEEGKLEIAPTQSLETYWYNVVDDTPTVAGLNDVVPRLLALPEELSSESDRAQWNRMLKCLPSVAEKDQAFLPARQFDTKRSNVENPDLYPVFPFHLCNISTDNVQVGINTFNNRIENDKNFGWTQDGQQAARLGMTKEAAELLVGKLVSNPVFRFPAFWGPNYNCVPDQDHGSSILMNLQDMVLQTYNGVDYILPAFPEEWGVEYKLHSFAGKVVKGKKQMKK